MNNEYMILSDGSVAIVNENGKLEKRNFDDKYYLNEILMRENKIEMINDEIKELNKDLTDNKELVFFCRNMMKVQPILIALATIGGFVFGGIFSTGDFITYGIYHGLQGLVYSSIIATVPLIGGKIVKLKSTRKVIGLESTIEKANKIKEQYEKELSEIKQKKITESKIIYKINNPVSLKNQNEFAHSQIENELNFAYENAINNKPKKLVLNRK